MQDVVLFKFIAEILDYRKCTDYEVPLFFYFILNTYFAREFCYCTKNKIVLDI